MNALVSRRRAFLGLGALFVPGCAAPSFFRAPEGDELPAQVPASAAPGRAPFADNVDALMDTLLPEERDAAGARVSPGARDVGAGALLDVPHFLQLAMARGLVGPLPAQTVTRLEALGDAGFRPWLNRDLDVLAFARRPLTPFRELPAQTREQIVLAAFDDPLRRSGFLVVRAACFTAFLGGVSSDAGLVFVGHPPFEDLAGGLAVSGYPRTTRGRLVDAEREDLAALAARGELDDYTENRAPAATAGEDLSKILDANGDLF